MSRPRLVSREDLEAFLEHQELVTFHHLRNHFDDVRFDPESAYRWLAEAGWEPVNPRSRDLWHRCVEGVPSTVKHARYTLGMALTAARAKLKASTAGVVVSLNGCDVPTIARLFKAAELDEVDLVVPAEGGVLLSVHPDTQSEVVRAVYKLMSNPEQPSGGAEAA